MECVFLGSKRQRLTRSCPAAGIRPSRNRIRGSGTARTLYASAPTLSQRSYDTQKANNYPLNVACRKSYAMRMNKRICIRSAKKEEWESILKIQRRAIHEIACADYPPAILDLWGTPLNRNTISWERTNFDRKSEQGVFTIVAEISGTIAGFGEVIPKENLLLAVYINPDFKRQGVGTAIVLELEEIAKKQGADFLQMDASLTAENFYISCGYQVIERGFHTISSTEKMALCKNEKKIIIIRHARVTLPC